MSANLVERDDTFRDDTDYNFKKTVRQNYFLARFWELCERVWKRGCCRESEKRNSCHGAAAEKQRGWEVFGKHPPCFDPPPKLLTYFRTTVAAAELSWRPFLGGTLLADRTPIESLPLSALPPTTVATMLPDDLFLTWLPG